MNGGLQRRVWSCSRHNCVVSLAACVSASPGPPSRIIGTLSCFIDCDNIRCSESICVRRLWHVNALSLRVIATGLFAFFCFKYDTMIAHASGCCIGTTVFHVIAQGFVIAAIPFEIPGRLPLVRHGDWVV